jgi:cellulose synthase/poly-beta-1,6-N-acetylglucosamine synthase-like glycosyltransferase
MTTIIEYVLLVLAGLLAVPVITLVVEIIAALILTKRGSTQHMENAQQRRVCVLVPAHNESAGLLPTLENIKAQLQSADRLLVVADNCDDDTAAIAKAAGAEVVERHQPTRIGKGFALDLGLKHLSRDPPAIVIVIDADCRLASGAIDQLAMTCAMTRRPVQALDLMTAPDDSPVNYRVAEFAWRVKNWVRPLGLYALGLPCQLMGTGMAFPWDIIRTTGMATTSIVEDLQLGLDLAARGAAPLFCPSAAVTSQFPMSAEGAEKQRKRWEEGHIKMIFGKIPSCIYKAITQRNLGLLALTFDLAIPPLSLLVMLLTVVFFFAGLAALFGVPSTSLIISGVCLSAVASTVFLSWLKWGRDVLPPSAMLSVASYCVAKLPLYHHILSRSAASEWIRTDRKKKE